jgi:hypothetical protein
MLSLLAINLNKPIGQNQSQMTTNQPLSDEWVSSIQPLDDK